MSRNPPKADKRLVALAAAIASPQCADWSLQNEARLRDNVGTMTEFTIALPDGPTAARLAGRDNEHFKLLADELNVQAAIRDGLVVLSGETEPVQLAGRLLESLSPLWRSGELSLRKLRYALHALQDNPATDLGALFTDSIIQTVRGKPIKPQTLKQKQYLDAITKHPITFGIGPAGTGKTYLAVVMGVLALREKQVNKLILTRPIIEAGEALGFLPGDVNAKVDPYFRPIYDALYDLLDVEKFQKLVERNVIEIAPLAYMRGRTLQEAFIILDEAQNTSPLQMKMFLTRLGVGSRAVITGDPTQIDLPAGKPSGLADAARVLADVKDIAQVHFSSTDVVRHPLVQKILNAYDAQETATRS